MCGRGRCPVRDWIYGFFMAWGMFLAIPCPKKIWSESARRKMLACLPLVGIVVGAVWALAAWLELAVMTDEELRVNGVIRRVELVE